MNIIGNLMMASFVRIIPNKLWEEIKAKGLLDKAYPTSKKTKIEELLENVPQTLHHIIEKTVNTAKGLLDWNKERNLVVNSEPIPGSDVAELLQAYITKSDRLGALPGGQEIVKIFENAEKNKKVEDHQSPLYSPVEPLPKKKTKKNGGGKIRQKKVPKRKNSRRAVGSGRVSKKHKKLPRKPKKNSKSAKRT